MPHEYTYFIIRPHATLTPTASTETKTVFLVASWSNYSSTLSVAVRWMRATKKRPFSMLVACFHNRAQPLWRSSPSFSLTWPLHPTRTKWMLGTWPLFSRRAYFPSTRWPQRRSLIQPTIYWAWKQRLWNWLSLTPRRWERTLCSPLKVA